MRGLAKVFGGNGAVVLTLSVLVASVFAFQHQGQVDLNNSQKAGCERSRASTSDVAQAFRAQSDYLNGVLDSQSVNQIVKDKTSKVQVVVNRSATGLESRTGKNLDCDKAFPDPTWNPFD